jgi:DedD protein
MLFLEGKFMDKNVTRRIIGVLVVIALVIIVLPLAVNDHKPQVVHTAEIKAPPFPEPKNEIATIPTTVVVAENKPQQNPVVAVPIANTDVLKTKVTVVAKVLPVTPVITAPKLQATKAVVSEPTNLSNLKKPAWVVQLGSFKNESNAIRLMNMLRTKGFKAFTYKTKHNDQTCVYVGPEFKQVTASALANQINHEVSMRGMIVSYNPLEI